MEQKLIMKNEKEDIFSVQFAKVEISDDLKRAIIEIPLMHEGANKKGLFWTAKMLKEIAPLFKGVAFRYDLNGQEGSSHTINKLSSPHFDVGWTYKNEQGAWFDEKDNILWVKGEVTHPDVVAKLSRSTTDGQKELNYASMGVIVENAICSICGKEYGTCEHERLQPYQGQICYKVPTDVSKALHVALTNDPADGEAEIAKCIFQELGGNNMFDNKMFTSQVGGGYQSSPNDIKNQGSTVISPTSNSQIPGGLAPSSPQTGQLGMAPSPEVILKDLAERIKTLEQKAVSQTMAEPQPELINSAPQDNFTQSGMSMDANPKPKQEGSKMDVKAGQVSNEKTPVNPVKTEGADLGSMQQPQQQGGGAQQALQLLKQAIALLTGTEVQDAGELLNANKGKAKHDEDEGPLEHMGPGEAVTPAAEDDASNKKNKQHLQEPGKVATADSEVEKLKTELADMKKQQESIMKKFELQDNNVPEFGGVSQKESVEVSDMSADQRGKTFGDYGKWDACFNGAGSASKFKR